MIDIVHPFFIATFLIWNRKEYPHYVFNNDRQHVAAYQGNSSTPTNATHLLHHCHTCTNLAVAPLHTSIKSPITTRQLVACALPRMTWQVHSASHKRLNLVRVTTVRVPKEFADVDRYAHLYLIIYLSVYISIFTYICICTNNVCLYP